MKTIIFLIIITLLAFLIAKTFQLASSLGVEASLPPQSPSLPQRDSSRSRCHQSTPAESLNSSPCGEVRRGFSPCGEGRVGPVGLLPNFAIYSTLVLSAYLPVVQLDPYSFESSCERSALSRLYTALPGPSPVAIAVVSLTSKSAFCSP